MKGRWKWFALGLPVGLLALPFLVMPLLPARYTVNAPLGQLLFGFGQEAPPESAMPGRLQVPAGFALTRFAEKLDRPRLLRVTPAGDLLVTLMRAGKVVLLERDANGDGRADGQRTLLEGLKRPHGLDLAGGWLYVAETDAVGRVRFDPQQKAVAGSYERIVQGLPGGGNHTSRTLRVGPDGLLYVSIGSSCNACVEEDKRRAAVVRYKPDGTGEELFASGLRNAVGLAFKPGTPDLYATDNGRDLLGDDFPPCELNLVRQGKFYGWPFANGDRQPDPDHGAGHEQQIAASEPPLYGFAAHTAPLGLTFLQSERLPRDYRGSLLVAEHGSWNRTRKSGYKVVRLRFTPEGIAEDDFLTGFEKDEDVVGRPVDVAEGTDGTVYVSDDYGGVIYRVGVSSGATTWAPPTAAASEDESATAAPPPVPEWRLQEGAALYERWHCASCHEGVAGRPLTDLRSGYTPETLAEFLAAPNPPMPSFPLKDDERASLAAWLLHREARPASPPPR